MLAIAAGTLLRIWNLRDQVLGGDELYAVEVALNEPLADILTTYRLKDASIPLTAIYRLLIQAGLAPTELLFRLPVLLCGLATLVVFPLWARRRLGTGIAGVYAWLIALSPALVLYSRIARPYMPVVLLSFVAVASFDAWWHRPRAWTAILYATTAAFTSWFHLASAPFVCAPLLFAALSKLRGRARGPDLRALLGVGLLTALAFGAFMAPAWPSLRALIAAKHNPLGLRLSTLTGVLRLQAGSANSILAGLFWIVTMAGLWRMARRQARVTLYTLFLVATQIGGLLFLSPEMLVHPMMFSRYLLPALPWVLLWAAGGLALPWGPSVGSRARWQPLAAAVALLALLAGGPLARKPFWSSSFVHHNDFVAFFCPPASIDRRKIPAVYTEVLAQADDAPVLELPWHRWWTYMQVFYLYQMVHGQDVLVSLDRPLEGGARLEFRNLVFGTAPELLSSRARFLVLHTDLPLEERRVQGHCWQILDEMKSHHANRLRRRGRWLNRRLTELWGPPDYSEKTLRVWDLGRVRGDIRESREGEGR